MVTSRYSSRRAKSERQGETRHILYRSGRDRASSLSATGRSSPISGEGGGQKAQNHCDDLGRCAVEAGVIRHGGVVMGVA